VLLQLQQGGNFAYFAWFGEPRECNFSCNKVGILPTSPGLVSPGLYTHQTRQSGQNSHLVAAEVTLPRLQSEINVALFIFESHFFLTNINNLCFMVKFIDKAIVINLKMYINERKRF
jgi:hypothetical protein